MTENPPETVAGAVAAAVAEQAAAPTPRDLARDRSIMFDDLPIEAQNERMRDVVRHLDREVGVLRGIVEKLLRHQHGAAGELVVPITLPMAPTDKVEREPAKRWL